MLSADSSLQTAMYTRANGRKTKLMVKERICMLTVPSMKDTGSMISSRDMARKYGLISQVTRVSIKTARRTARESSRGLMEHLMREIGLIIRCMEVAYSTGQTGEDMKESTRMIESTVKAPSTGLTVGNVKANGVKESR